MIKIYKQSNNGNVGILTNCLSNNDFLNQLSDAIVKYIKICDKDESYRDQKRDLEFILENAYDILEKLAGKENKNVKQQYLLFAGDTWPTSLEIPKVETDRLLAAE